MTSRDKAAVIIVMWMIAAVLSFFTLVGRSMDGWVALIVIGLIGSAVGGSVAITAGTQTVVEPSREHHVHSSGKAKTSDMSLVDRMIDSMSDEEIAVLRRRLALDNNTHMGDDGELLSLEEALKEKRRRGG
ncbi:MAG: hypothetical protein KC547_07900 [Anaerolineae bacterium]|nr:hypothetical protein [Anaerolineae bacterium]